jgi:hypothetical protein
MSYKYIDFRTGFGLFVAYQSSCRTATSLDLRFVDYVYELSDRFRNIPPSTDNTYQTLSCGVVNDCNHQLYKKCNIIMDNDCINKQLVIDAWLGQSNGLLLDYNRKFIAFKLSSNFHIDIDMFSYTTITNAIYYNNNTIQVVAIDCIEDNKMLLLVQIVKGSSFQLDALMKSERYVREHISNVLAVDKRQQIHITFLRKHLFDKLTYYHDSSRLSGLKPVLKPEHVAIDLHCIVHTEFQLLSSITCSCKPSTPAQKIIILDQPTLMCVINRTNTTPEFITIQ